jgi:hypothetical protein
MNVKRIVAIGAVGGALAAWLAAASTMLTQPAVETPVPRATGVELRGAALAAEITRLRERLRPTSAPELPSRNLFEFSRAAPARADSPAPRDLAEAEAEAPRPPAPAAPLLKLVGMAEDPGPDGPVRTAIISGLGQLFLVKEGERVTSRYQVAKISGEAAEIRDLGDNSTVTLVLK